MLRLFVLSICLAILIKLIPRRRHYLQTCREIINSLPKSRYDELCDFIPDGPKSHDQSFWAVSQGIRGLVARMRVSYLCLRFLQANIHEGSVELEDARQVWIMAFGQLAFSAIAMPEAVICRIFKVRHMCARYSVQFYCVLLVRTNTLCYSSAGDKCPIGLHDLL